MWDVYNWAYTIYMYGVIFKYWKDRLFIWTESGPQKKSDSTCKNTSIKHLKIEIEIFWVDRFWVVALCPV